MNFGRVLSETLKALRESDIPAIVVGGVAIAAHGVVRGTQDLDLAISSVDADAAVAALESLGFETFRRTAGFSNHSRPGTAERVDLLFVSGPTAEALLARARPQALFDSDSVPIVDPEHLVAMKLFALKQNPTRQGIDLEDVRALLLKGLVDRPTVLHYLDRYELAEYRRALGFDA